MSAQLSPRQALAMIPGWENRSASVTDIEGGLSNRSYRISSEDEIFVLRLDSRQSQIFDLNRKAESCVLRNAAASGLAPEIIYSNTTDGILLTRFLRGEVWTAQQLAEPHNLDALAGLLKRVHALPLIAVAFDAGAVARKYRANISGQERFLTFADDCAAVVAASERPSTFACCHNDIIAANIIATPGLMLLDWEYSCDNDPLFDLAAVIAYHDLDEAQARHLLSAYSDKASAEMLERLWIQVRVFDAIQWLWFASRQSVCPDADIGRRMEVIRRRRCNSPGAQLRLRPT